MKAQRVVWPSRAKIDIETWTLPPLGDDEVLVATDECTLISPGTERAFLLGLPNAQGRYPSPSGLQQHRYSRRSWQGSHRLQGW